MSTLPTQSTIPFFSGVVYPSVAIHPLPVVVPASGTNTVTAKEQPLTTYPSKEVGVEYTYASYDEGLSDLAFKLASSNSNGWTLSLPIPTPSFANPTLTSFTYIIKYATTHDNGNSTVQADVVLTTVSCPVGIIVDSTDLGIYRNVSGYGPRMVDNSKAVSLSSAPAIKCNGGTSQWSHYIDHRHLKPTVQIVGSANLVLNFHVREYPTAETLRRLAIEVSATWFDAAAEAKAAKQAEEEHAVIAAPIVADTAMQELIAAKVEEMKLDKCSAGYEWVKSSTGYVCAGGGHHITFEQLGMKS